MDSIHPSGTWCIKKQKNRWVGHFKTLSGHFLANYINNFHKIELQTIILMCLTCRMPVPSACSKIIFTTFKFFWACSIFFEHSHIFWSWSKARFYLINFHIWAWSKIFEHIQKILNMGKYIWTWSKNIWTSRWIRH